MRFFMSVAIMIGLRRRLAKMNWGRRTGEGDVGTMIDEELEFSRVRSTVSFAHV